MLSVAADTCRCHMGEAALWGAVGASALVIAAEAFDRASINAGLATVGGFALVLWLTTFEM